MQSITEISELEVTQKSYHPSPDAWEDQVIYFLLVDRFSDGKEARYLNNAGEFVDEGDTPPFVGVRDRDSAIKSRHSQEKWQQAGLTWCGGNLRGLLSKLGYLKRLGVTTIWVSPVLKQCVYAENSYHGYGIQNFLEIDPHFGSKDDLRDLVATAHEMGMYVILDIILNHTGDVFAYAPDRYPIELPDGGMEMDARWDGNPYDVAGFRDKDGQPNLPFGPVDLAQYPDAYPDGAVWPAELQNPDCFTRKGRIVNWDHHPEYEEGDFFALKDVHLGTGEGESFEPSAALHTLVEIYKYWIAFADLDGYRLDTVKHMSADSVAYFTRAIHNFTRSIGKNNFYIIGEIVGARVDTCAKLECTTLDAALGIGEIPEHIRSIITGERSPSEYFDIFLNTRKEQDTQEALWWRNRVITFFDDHDLVGQERKQRLVGGFPDELEAHRAIIRAFALQVLSLGIPCMYYGTEQGFDGHVLEETNDSTSEAGLSPSTDDRYIRECMFGGEFGAFRSRNRHCFNEQNRTYQAMIPLLEKRRIHSALRRGRQYLREISEDGEVFQFPEPGNSPYQGVIAWSRLLDVDEFVCAINTDPHTTHSVFVTIDRERHEPGSRPLECLYSTDAAQIGTTTTTPDEYNGSAVCIVVPPGGVVLYR